MRDNNAEVVESNAGKSNKFNHMTNGNMMDINHQTFAQINTGKGIMIINNMLLLSSLARFDPDFVIISKRNVNTNDPSLMKPDEI